MIGEGTKSTNQRRHTYVRDHVEVGFFTDPTVCIGCKACEVACKEWNHVPDDGFVWSGNSYDNTGHLGARRRKATLLAIVTKRAFECAAGVGQGLWAPVNHAKRARDDAIPAAIANVVLHEHRSDFGPNNCARGTCFKTTGFLTVLAHIGEKDPAKRIFSVAAH